MEKWKSQNFKSKNKFKSLLTANFIVKLELIKLTLITTKLVTRDLCNMKFKKPFCVIFLKISVLKTLSLVTYV